MKAARIQGIVVQEQLNSRLFNKRSKIIPSLIALMFCAGSINANAALVSPCSGVSLEPSIVTDMIGDSVLPVLGTLDGVLGLLLGPLGLSSNLNATLGSIAAGDPIGLNVLDQDGNLVSPSDACDTTADGYSLNTPKGISIGGNQITGLGNGAVANAGELNSIAFGNNSVTHALALNSIAIGPDSSVGSLGTNSLALGNGANINVSNSVALGANSTALIGAETNYTAYALSGPQNSVGEVSMGSAGNERKVTNVAAGSNLTDAVNVSQLQVVNDNLQALDDNAVKYDAGSLKMTVTLGGPLSVDGGTTGGTRVTNLAKGNISANSTDAVNGSQLFGITAGLTTSLNFDALGNSVANNLGGGAVYNSTTGAVSAPTYNVYGVNHNNVGSAINALQSIAPVQYSDASGVATPTVISNDVTLVGATSDPVRIHNVAAGIAPTDAVNVSQLDALAGDIDYLDTLAVKYDNASLNSITLGDGTLSTDGGLTGGTLISNLQQGAVNATSTDAINGAQLYATNQMVMNMSNGGGIKYFRANSSLADSVATGSESVAIGPESLASGDFSIAMGFNSQATNTGAIAIGQDSLSSGVNSIAIGTGALATGSVAVGAGAQAGNGGAAFGDNAIALTPQQGTAIGNGAVVTSDRGVALGAGAVANRDGMNGAAERFSNVTVASPEGAVSLGSAGNERQITNVAGGTADTDAVNVRQLSAAVAQSSVDIQNRIDALKNDMSGIKQDANAGTAAAMALASMPQSVIPGKVMMAAGVSNYQGQSAISVGVSNFSENGRWVVNFNGAANTRGNAGAAVGVGFHW